MEALAATSFDRYARYSYTYSLRTAVLSSSPLRILDVGDPYGTLAGLFPGDHTVSVDLIVSGARDLRGTNQHVIGSGTALPFPDASFDLVTAHDVLEHVPNDMRSALVTELLRVSAGPVVVAAPFSDPRTVACERMVNDYYVRHVGRSLEPLDEHAAEGLPDLDRLVADLDRSGTPHVVYSDGWLFHWLAFMLLKAHYVSFGAAALDRATDAAFNRLLRERDGRVPHYRRAVILRPPPGTEEALGPAHDLATAGVAADLEELEAVAWDLMHALPSGEDPTAADSMLRRWFDRSEEHTAEVALLVDSLRTVLDEVSRAVDDSSCDARRPTVTAVVLRRSDQAAERAVATLSRIEELASIVACRNSAVDGPDRFVQGVRIVEVDLGDDAVQLALAAEELSSDAMLVVDPDIDLDQVRVRELLSAYGASDHCVGYHRVPEQAVAQVASLRTQGDRALYVARELFIVDLGLYRNAGGLDGRFRGHLDDVDLGWRLNVIGYAVRTLGPATWSAPIAPAAAELDRCVLWSWIKNLDHPMSEQLLPGALMGAMFASGEGSTAGSFFDGFETLLDARTGIAALRRVDDADVLDRFGLPSVTAEPTGVARSVWSRIHQAFPTSPVGTRRRSGVLLLASGPTRERMEALAALLSREVEVTVAAPEDAPVTASWSAASDRPDEVQKLADHVDVIVVPAMLVSRYRALLATWNGILVVDLADAGPDLDEDLALARGDAFVCDTDEQRDYWLRDLEARGRSDRASDRPDELVSVIVTPSLARVFNPVSATRRDVVVVDLFGLPADGLSALHGAVAAVAEDLGVAMVVLGPDADGSSDEERRRASLRRARLVVRPTPQGGPTLASARWGVDALASGAPLLTTESEPAATFVRASGAGAVVGADPASVADQVRDALIHEEVLAAWQRRAASAAVVLAQGLQGASLTTLARRPWPWRFAHRRGSEAVAGSDLVAQLLDEREVEVTRSVAAALTAEMEARVAEAAASARLDLEHARRRLAAVEDELNEVRHREHLLRSHPLVRSAVAVKRTLSRRRGG